MCNKANKKYKKHPSKYICNEKTNRWVLKDGKIGREIIMMQQTLYKNTLHKTKQEYNLIIPILDKLKVSYETWNNSDNTAGTCFWHAISTALNKPINDISKDILVMTPELPPNIKSEYKTKEKVHNLLNRYKHREFGVSLNDYCIIPSIYKDTMIVVFMMQEVKPSIFKHHETMFIYHNFVLPTKVIFLCDFDYLDGDAHTELMTVQSKQISQDWTQDLTTELKELLLILMRNK